MSGKTHWSELRRRQISRRALMQGSARAALGAAGLAVVGCATDAAARELETPAAAAVPARAAAPEPATLPSGERVSPSVAPVAPANLGDLVAPESPRYRSARQPMAESLLPPQQDDDDQQEGGGEGEEGGEGDGDGGQGGFQLPPDQMDELAPGVYHFWGAFVSSLVVISGDDVLVTDPAIGFRGEGIKAKIAEVTDKPVNKLVFTHEHYDHVGGWEVFPEATIIAQQNAIPVFELMVLQPQPPVHCSFQDYLRVQAGDVVVDLHFLGPGDGDATTVIWLPNERIVQTSDMYEPRALSDRTVIDDKNFMGTRKILAEISKWDVEYAINAHSPGNSWDALNENVQYYNDLFDAVMAEIDKVGGRENLFATSTLVPTIGELVSLPQYSEWGNYETALSSHAYRMLQSIFHGD